MTEGPTASPTIVTETPSALLTFTEAPTLTPSLSPTSALEATLGAYEGSRAMLRVAPDINAPVLKINQPSVANAVNRTITYTYDGLYRLTDANYYNGAVLPENLTYQFTYDYDRMGKPCQRYFAAQQYAKRNALTSVVAAATNTYHYTTFFETEPQTGSTVNSYPYTGQQYVYDSRTSKACSCGCRPFDFGHCLSRRRALLGTLR